ncbi:hypothetical protein TRFO_06924 [Tritrichomonas foetus]|uniref:Uncharacterized protein n=1 Tax=Tritrichomonas foetus TaxID=1144522 RepID=A0A1J4K041_9EUKA|nr:hypothetical protein TRFO_06924 [Tritrichomonas foetus]|eukprot:OHT02877.1 hypothetical protein TRFO_06924 [Tritrichomonas foetus]
MNTNLLFSLSLEGPESRNVILIIEGLDPTPMKEVRFYAPKNVKMFEVSIPIKNCTFPKVVSYNYAVNGVLLYPTNSTINLSRKPLTNRIVINDSKIQNSNCDVILILFVLSAPNIQDDQYVSLMTDSPVFLSNNLNYIKLEKKDGFWMGYGAISSFLNQPIVYKYAIQNQQGKEISREQGRSHTIFINSPIGNKNVTIYDTWNNEFPLFSFYPHVIKPYQTTINATTVSIEYTSKQPVKIVAIKGNNAAFKNQEPLYFDDCWRREVQLPAHGVKCDFEIGSSNSDNPRKLKWEKLPCYKIHENQIHQNVIASRLLFGEGVDKMLGIYIPLVSIRANREQNVGDFSTLVSLAKWAKHCGIGCIHVHIEKLQYGLLDPIHANGLFWSQPGQLPEIRDNKIKALYQNYQTWLPTAEQDQAYHHFITGNSYIIQHCDNDFAKWTQYILYSQLYAAFCEIIDIGVKLITDVIKTEENDMLENEEVNVYLNRKFEEMKNEINVASHYSHGIKLVGIKSLIDKSNITENYLKGLFGELSGYVMKSFFLLTSNTLTLLQNATNPAFIQNFISQLSPDKRDDFQNKLDQLFLKMTEFPDFWRRIASIANHCPATLFLDTQTSSTFQSPNISSSLHVVFSSPSEVNDKNSLHALVPNFMSPEMVSEFPEQATADEISEKLKQKINSSEKYVEVFLIDALRAMGNQISFEPLQMIKGRCRFLLPFTIEDLLCDSEINGKIREVLNSGQRSV